MQTDAPARRQTLARLRDLATRAREELTIFCAHDLTELETRQRAAESRHRMAGPAARAPAPPLDAGGSALA